MRQEWWKHWEEKKMEGWIDEGKHKQAITIFGKNKSSIHNTNNMYEEEVLLFYKGRWIDQLSATACTLSV